MKRLAIISAFLSLSISLFAQIDMDDKQLNFTHDYTVIISLGPDCPISQKYIHTLKILFSDYNDKVGFMGIVPANFDSTEVAQFVRDYEIPFPVTIDKNNAIIRKLNFNVTPEAALLRGEKILYQGAINNWFYALGKSRAKVTEHYLINAIDIVLNEKEPKVSKTKAIGCLIESVK